MRNTLLKLLEEDCRLTPEQIAVMCDKEVGDIKALITEEEKSGVILGYKAVVDWEKAGREFVTALIELKVTPQRDRGFDRIAERIYNYPEVRSLYLMSGAFDFAVMLEGKTLSEVAYFVAQKLAPLEGVISTSTHFVLRKYKDEGVVFKAPEEDQRGNII